MINKDDFISGVRNKESDDLKFKTIINNQTVINNGYFLYENIRYYMFAKRITISQYNEENNPSGFPFPIINGTRIKISSDYSFKNPIFFISSLNKILITNTNQEYIDINDILDIDFTIDFDGKDYYIVINQDYNEEFFIVYNQDQSININLNNVNNSKFILGEKSPVLSNLSIECLSENKSDLNFIFLSTLTNNQNVPMSGIDVSFYKISTVYDSKYLTTVVNKETICSNKNFKKVGDREFYIPEEEPDYINNIHVEDKIYSEYLPDDTTITFINRETRIIEVDKEIQAELNENVIIKQIYRNTYEPFFTKIISTDTENYWTGYKLLSTSTTDELGNITDNMHFEKYEDKIFVFSALTDKSLQSELYWIDLSANYTSSSGISRLDDNTYKLAAQEALTAMGVDIWNEFWSEDVNSQLRTSEITSNTAWYSDRRSWRNKHYFLERAPINYLGDDSGDGSIQNPYQIRTYHDLETKINSDEEINKHYILLNDITVTVNDSENILNSFNGYLDGQGYTINIININKTEDNVGLFKELIDAKINNIIIKVNNNGIIKGYNNVGILAGKITGNTTLNRVACYGRVEGRNYIGGIVGKVEGSLNISYSSFTGDIQNENVNDENTYVGGVTGYINYFYNNKYSKLFNIHTEGNIKINSTSSLFVNNYIFAGGICGYINYNTTFSNTNKIGKYLISSIDIDGNNSRTIAASIFAYIDPDMCYFDNVISLNEFFINVLSDSTYQSNKLIGTYNNIIVNTYSGCSLDTTTINNNIPIESQANGVYHNITFFRSLDNYNNIANNLSFNIDYIWKSTNSNNFYKGFPIFTWQQDILNEQQDGSANYPWHITNIDELIKLRLLVNNNEAYKDWAANDYFIITQDLYAYLLTDSWTPIGTTSNPFEGHLNGGDHEIIGLHYSDSNYPGNHDKPIGLFGCISGAEIHNLTVISTIEHDKNYTGSIVGIAKNHSLIQNCYVSSTIDLRGSLNNNSLGTGLICGCLQDSNIINCVNNDGSILKVENNSNVIDNVGGICGKIERTLEDINNEYNHIINCHINCTIQGLFKNVGGILGYCNADNAIIKNNYCISSIYWIDNITENYGPNLSQFVGGICGRVDNAYMISINLFEGKEISDINYNLYGMNYIGGICGYLNSNIIFNNNNVNNAKLFFDYSNTGATKYLGGIIASNQFTTIDRCLFYGELGYHNNLSTSSPIYLCGIAYYTNAGITNCYSIITKYNGNNDVFGYRIGTSADNHDNLDNNYSCEVPDCPHMNSNSSIYHQNGQTKTLEQLKQQSTYDVFDFENIWMMSNLYPILQISNILLNNNLNTNEESNYTSTTIQHTITDEYSGRWNFNDYYNKYLKDTTILLSSARDNIGNYMSCAYQGYLGHIKLSGQDILDMTIKGDDGYLVNSEYRAIQEKYNTKDTLEDLILNPNDDFYTIAYNLVPRTEYKDWLESFKNTYDVASNNEGDYYMLDFDRRLGTVFESPFPNVITRSDYLTPNSVVTTDVGDYGYNSIDPSYWINKISKVEHINPLGSFNNLIYHLNHDTDVLHYDIYFSEGNKPPTWQELKYVFYIPSRVYYNNEHNLTKKDFFDIIMSNGCYFRGLAVMFAYCSLINGLEYYDSNPNLQFPYAPYYSDFKLGELIDEYLYNNNTTFKHYKL